MRLVTLFLLFCVVSQASTLTDYDSQFRQKYSSLHQKPVWKDEDGSLRFDEARLYRQSGLRILFLRGDEYEMAYQHGRLLADEIPKGAIPQSAELVSDIIENRFGHRPLISKLAQWAVDRFVSQKLIQNGLSSDPALVMAQLGAGFGLSHGAGIKAETVLTAVYAPEVLMVLANGQKDKSEAGKLPALLASCTDFAAWGSSTESGEVIIGRNLDYPLTGYFDKFPTVIYFEPTNGGQRYMGVSSSGVHNAGLTGFNESGIFLGAHTIPTNDTNIEGKPGFVIANEVLRHAHNFDEAVALFKKANPASGYAYTLVSTRERRAATVELSGHHVAVREQAGEKYAQSNHYRHPEMLSRYLSVNQGVDEDSWARLLRVEQRLETAVTPKGAMEILADQFDPFKKEVVSHGYTVAVSTTVSSAVVLPERNQILVSTAMAPTSHGVFVSLPLVIHSAEDFASYVSEEVDNMDFIREHPNKYEAVQSFIRAKQRYGYDNDVAGAIAGLDEALEWDGGNRNLAFMKGVLRMKQSNGFSRAAQIFESLLGAKNDRPQLLGRYFLARIHADVGSAQKARGLLMGLVSDSSVDAKLRNAARESLSKLNRWGRVRLRPGKYTLLMQQSDLPGY